MRIPFVQVDVFADAVFGGNPAAVMPLSAWLDDDLLQRIAAENNLSETAFLIPCDADDAEFELRWFTPANEVQMCGHATLASGHVVLSSDTASDRVRFRTRRAGVLVVERQAGGGYALDLPVWRAEPRALDWVVAGLGVDPARVVETRWHDSRYARVALETADDVRGLTPDFRALAAAGDVLTIATAPGDTTDIISRAFVPGAGIDEDPVTGSAHAVLAPYWAERLGRDSFTALQASKRGGRLTVTMAGDRVVLGGGCVTVIEGTFLLP